MLAGKSEWLHCHGGGQLAGGCGGAGPQGGLSGVFGCLVCSAVVAVLVRAAGPCQCRPVRLENTGAQVAAVLSNSADRESQRPTAAIGEPDPGPLCIRPELTSGGNKAKSIVPLFPSW